VDGAGEGATIVLDENCTVSTHYSRHSMVKSNMFCAGDVMGPRSAIKWLYLPFFDVIIIRTRLPTFYINHSWDSWACHSVVAYCVALGIWQVSRQNRWDRSIYHYNALPHP
jgi:hypothetical protein